MPSNSREAGGSGSQIVTQIMISIRTVPIYHCRVNCPVNRQMLVDQLQQCDFATLL